MAVQRPTGDAKGRSSACGSFGSADLESTSPALRASCQACAVSKVKCPKEKPLCSRCKSRGISCQYFITRRPGRKREARRPSLPTTTAASTASNSSAENEVSHPVGGIRFLTDDTASIQVSGATSYLDSSSLCLSPTIYSQAEDIFSTDSSDAFCMFEETTMLQNLADFSASVKNVDFFLDSPFTTPGLDHGTTAQTRTDVGSLLIPADVVTPSFSSPDLLPAADSLSASTRSHSFATDIASSTTEISSPSRLTLNTTTCGCLPQALDLLKSLSYPMHSSPNGNINDDPMPILNSLVAPSPDKPGPVQTMLIENKEGIDATICRLACETCVGDSILLSVLVMTVLRIVDRYAATTQIHSSCNNGERSEDAEMSDGINRPRRKGRHSVTGKQQVNDRMIVGGAYHGDNNTASAWNEDTRGREVAQLVLSELHRVQRLVGQLAPRLREVRDRNARQIGAPESEPRGRQKATREGGKLPVAAFSAETLARMESDIRNSLSGLSSEIITRLRES